MYDFKTSENLWHACFFPENLLSLAGLYLRMLHTKRLRWGCTEFDLYGELGLL